MFSVILAVCLLIGGFPLLSDPEYKSNGRVCIAIGLLIIFYRILVYYQPFEYMAYRRKMRAFEDSMKSKSEQPESLTEENARLKIELAESKNICDAYRMQINKICSEASEKDAKISASTMSKTSQIESLLKENASLKTDCDTYRKQIAQICCEISEKDDQITLLNRQLMDKNNTVSHIKDGEMAELKFQLEYSEAKISKLNGIISDQQKTIEKLKSAIIDLEGESIE